MGTEAKFDHPHHSPLLDLRGVHESKRRARVREELFFESWFLAPAVVTSATTAIAAEEEEAEKESTDTGVASYSITVALA
jgi:hypothetical protein